MGKTTGFNAALYRSSADSSDEYNVAFAVDYWLRKGTPKEKLILGLATYGRSFKLQDENNFGVGAPAQGPDPRGNTSQRTGFSLIMTYARDKFKESAKHTETRRHRRPFLFRRTFGLGLTINSASIQKLTTL